MPKWIEFAGVEPAEPRLTRVWSVKTKGSGVLIGIVSWHSPWRKYTFTPSPWTIFEQDCLRDIAEFIETETRKRRFEKSRERAARKRPV